MCIVDKTCCEVNFGKLCFNFAKIGTVVWSVLCSSASDKFIAKFDIS